MNLGNENFMKEKLLISFIFLYLICKLTCSCNEPNVYLSSSYDIDLGNNYYFLADANESQILLNSKSEAKSKVGKTIIPPEVILYNYDENFIIAQTLEKINGKELYKYWIVEKMKKNQYPISPLDSLTFFKSIDSLQIKLKPRG